MTIMAQPTQDMDISSSSIPSDSLSNNDSLKKFYIEEIAMNERNETNLAQIHSRPTDLSEKYENQEFLDSQSFDVKSSEDTFPWLIKFNKMMCSSVGSRTYQMLERLLLFYTQNILSNINTYCVKTFSMLKLKNHINNTLTFFHLYWHDVKEYAGECDSYLNRMSVLLEIYIDMELKAFRHPRDSSKIAAKLLSALWIYLNNSEKHIFRVLLKLKLITKKHTQICDPILIKSFTSLRRRVQSLTDIEYVRYLLVLKMWKRMKGNLEEKKEVNKMASMILGPYTPKMREELLKIIPQSSVEHKNETLWLLQSNVFDLKAACNNFLAFEDTMSFQYKEPYMPNTSDLNNSQKSQTTSLYGSNNIQECAMSYELHKTETSSPQNNHSFKNITHYSKPTKQIFSVKRKNKFKKYKAASKLKPGEIILIDLTEENESVRPDTCKKTKKKGKRKLEWLKMMKEKYKVKKQCNEIKCKSQVEIADAHSTENSENSVGKIALEHLPISDNKVSESTESCALPERDLPQDNIYYINSQDMNDYVYKKKNKDLKCMFHHKQRDICTSPLKQNDVQQTKVLRLLKLLNAVGQNIKEPKAVADLLKDREQNVMSTQHTFLCKSVANESSEINTQGKDESFSQPKCSIETILLSKECQNNVMNAQCIKQELPTSTDCNIIEADTYFQNKSVYVQSNCDSYDFKPLSNHNAQAIEAVKQKFSCDSHECTSCCKQSETKPVFYHNNNLLNILKSEDTIQNTIEDNITDKKTICDKNIICMLSDLDKCMGVLNRIGEHIMTVHAEKQRLECSDKTNVCAVSTTVFGDQITESSLDWPQNINSLTKEKLNKILELYGKKEFLTACNCKDTYKWNNQESNVDLNQLKCESDSSKKTMTSTTDSKELHSRGKDDTIFSQNKMSQKFACNHIKSEFEQSVKDEDNVGFEVMAHHPCKTSEQKITMVTNSKTNTIESFVHDLKNTEELKQEVPCESILQNFFQKTNIKEAHSVDEFENIDILDSILNGDITMEDEQEIFEDLQSSLMSPINYDNSNNVLNCITEFFSQSERMCANEKEKSATSNIENSLTPLPEGSLGTTGILNSLLDFDLTNMDSPPNDFMYSNVQTVNPRLIKKSFKEEILSAKNDSFELNYKEKPFRVGRKDEKNIFLQKEKELCSSQKNSIDSTVNVVGFGLNTTREGTLEFSSLTESTSASSGQSTLPVNSGNTSSELKKSFSKYSVSSPTRKVSTDTIMEKFYIFQKEDTINQDQSFNDTGLNRTLPETGTFNNMPSNAITNCISSPQDNFLSPNKHTADVRTSPLMMKQSLDSYDLMSTTDFMSCNTVIASQCKLSGCENSLNQRNIQKNVQHSCRGKQKCTMNHRLEVNAQLRTSKRKLRHKKKIKMEEEDELPTCIIQPDEDELNLRCPQFTVINSLDHQNVQGTCEEPLSCHTTYHKKSPHTMCVSKSIYKKLKCVDIQQLRSMSQQKQQISLSFFEDSMTNTIITEDSKLEDSQYTTEDNILKDLSRLNKPMKKPQLSQTTSYFKMSKKSMKIDTSITEVNAITNKRATQVSSNILHKSDTKLPIQNVDLHPLKFVKRQLVPTRDGETPLKKMKLTSKFSSMLETNASVCCVTQQETQKKRLTSMKRDLVCTNRKKNVSGE